MSTPKRNMEKLSLLWSVLGSLSGADWPGRVRFNTVANSEFRASRVWIVSLSLRVCIFIMLFDIIFISARNPGDSAISYAGNEDQYCSAEVFFSNDLTRTEWILPDTMNNLEGFFSGRGGGSSAHLPYPSLVYSRKLLTNHFPATGHIPDCKLACCVSIAFHFISSLVSWLENSGNMTNGRRG